MDKGRPEVLSGKEAKVIGAPTYGHSPYGQSVVLNGNDAIAVNDDGDYGGSRVMTVCYTVKTPASTTTNESLVNIWDHSLSPAVGLYFEMRTGGTNVTVQFSNSGFSSRTTTIQTLGTRIADGEWHTIVSRIETANGSNGMIDTWDNGEKLTRVEQLSPAFGATPPNSTPNAALSFGARITNATDSYGSNGLTGEYAFGYFAPHLLTDDQCQQMSANPLSIFQPAQSRLWEVALMDAGATTTYPHWIANGRMVA
jgi:hypothetical protein